MERIVKCDKCKKNFIQKWVGAKKNWSQINEVKYWIGDKEWKGKNHFCRSCLKGWFELERESFDKWVIDEKKRNMFFSYRGHGAFDKSDKVK